MNGIHAIEYANWGEAGPVTVNIVNIFEGLKINRLEVKPKHKNRNRNRNQCSWWKGVEETNAVAMFNNIEVERKLNPPSLSSDSDDQAQTKLNLLFEFNLLNQFGWANIHPLGTSLGTSVDRFVVPCTNKQMKEHTEKKVENLERTS